MLDGLKNKLRKFLGLEAKPDAEDDEAKAKLKQEIKNLQHRRLKKWLTNQK